MGRLVVCCKSTDKREILPAAQKYVSGETWTQVFVLPSTARSGPRAQPVYPNAFVPHP
jgi:hypothetical protein